MINMHVSLYHVQECCEYACNHDIWENEVVYCFTAFNMLCNLYKCLVKTCKFVIVQLLTLVLSARND